MVGDLARVIAPDRRDKVQRSASIHEISRVKDRLASSTSPQISAIHELLTGLHASGLAVSPDHRYVVCANAGSDHLSVIDTQMDDVIETVWARAKPSDLLGASPNALAFDSTGKRLYAANGARMQSRSSISSPKNHGDTQLLGLIPVG